MTLRCPEGLPKKVSQKGMKPTTNLLQMKFDVLNKLNAFLTRLFKSQIINPHNLEYLYYKLYDSTDHSSQNDY